MKTLITFCLLVGWVAFWIASAWAASEKAGIGIAVLIIPAAFVGVMAGMSYREGNP